MLSRGPASAHSRLPTLLLGKSRVSIFLHLFPSHAHPQAEPASPPEPRPAWLPRGLQLGSSRWEQSSPVTASSKVADSGLRGPWEACAGRVSGPPSVSAVILNEPSNYQALV